jgi:hypothetical protein
METITKTETVTKSVTTIETATTATRRTATKIVAYRAYLQDQHRDYRKFQQGEAGPATGIL